MMTRLVTLVALILFSCTAHAQELDWSSFGSTPLVQADFERLRVPIGKSGGQTVWGIPTWVEFNGVGLSASAQARLIDSLDCVLEATPSRLTVSACAMRQAGLVSGEWFQDTTPQPRYLGHAIVEYSVWQHLNWCAGNGTCSQSGRFTLLGNTWSTVADFASCLLYFPPIPIDTDGDTVLDSQRDFCGVAGDGKFLNSPPAIFGGVDPDHGRQ